MMDKKIFRVVVSYCPYLDPEENPDGIIYGKAWSSTIESYDISAETEGEAVENAKKKYLESIGKDESKLTFVSLEESVKEVKEFTELIGSDNYKFKDQLSQYRDLLLNITTQRRIFSELFSDYSVKLLNASDSVFFSFLQNILYNNLLLDLSKIIDGDRDPRILGLHKIYGIVKKDEKELNEYRYTKSYKEESIKHIYEDIKHIYESNLKNHRNSRLAHNEQNVIIGNKKLKSIDLFDVDYLIDRIILFMDRVDSFYEGCSWFYKEGCINISAKTMLYKLEICEKLKKWKIKKDILDGMEFENIGLFEDKDK
jgi:hypothetical protein